MIPHRAADVDPVRPDGRRPSRPRALAAASLILAMTVSARVDGWNAQGHRLVASIADQRLTPVARRHVSWLLGPESLADISSWADRYLDGVHQTFYWHFLNIPPEATGYDRDRDCPRQPGVAAGARADAWRDCAVDRIAYSRERLADAALDRADRAIALKFLVHLVGDLHQPFHALGVGHGGNDIPVRVFGSDTCGTRPCELHGVWDGGLIGHRNLNDERYLAALRDLIARRHWENQSPGTPAEWAMQSHALAKAALLPSHGIVDDAYYRAHIDVVDQRLALAGVRLAAILNEILTSPPPQG
jgi:hypothetical protein